MKRIFGTLWFEIVVSFSLFVLIGTVVIIGVVPAAIKAHYGTYVRDSDLAAAESLAVYLEDYYARTGSWEEVTGILVQPNAMHGGRRPPQERMMMVARMGVIPVVVLVDPDGGTIIDTRERDERVSLRDHQRGVPVRIDGEPVGYLFVGSMTGRGIAEVDYTLLQTINRSVILYTLGITAAALAFGTLLVTRLMRPIRDLTAASTRVAGGDFGTRVRAEGRNELGELARRFNAMTESLERADGFKKRLIADTAHELRTPVSLIKGRLEMMLDGIYPIDANGVRSLLEETELLTRLITELRLLADAESGSLPMEYGLEDLGEIAKQSVELFQPVADEKGIRIQVAIDPRLPPARVDSGRIRQVFTNLVSNALEHAEKGGEIRIDIGGSTDPDRLSVSVRDTGPGIPPAHLDAVFERFYRLDSPNGSGGRGLGLAISREIVRLHGGEMHAEDTGGKGASIVFSLPLGLRPVKFHSGG